MYQCKCNWLDKRNVVCLGSIPLAALRSEHQFLSEHSLSPNPIFIRVSEVAFCKKKIPYFIRADLRHSKKIFQILSKHVMRDFCTFRGPLTRSAAFSQNVIMPAPHIVRPSVQSNHCHPPNLVTFSATIGPPTRLNLACFAIQIPTQVLTTAQISYISNEAT